MMKRLMIQLLVFILLTALVGTVTFAQEASNLRVIEIRNGRLPEGVSGKDLTGPIVLMIDGELPEWASEQYLADIGATVFSVRSGDPLPKIITESDKHRLSQRGLAEEGLRRLDFVIVNDDVIAAGKAELDRQSGQWNVEPQQWPDKLSWTNIYESFPGSSIVRSSATQWSFRVATLRNVAWTDDIDAFIRVWSDDKTRIGHDLGIGGDAFGIDGHVYCLTAQYYNNGVLWDTGVDCMQL